MNNKKISFQKISFRRNIKYIIPVFIILLLSLLFYDYTEKIFKWANEIATSEQLVLLFVILTLICSFFMIVGTKNDVKKEIDLRKNYSNNPMNDRLVTYCKNCKYFEIDEDKKRLSIDCREGYSCKKFKKNIYNPNKEFCSNAIPKSNINYYNLERGVVTCKDCIYARRDDMNNAIECGNSLAMEKVKNNDFCYNSALYTDVDRAKDWIEKINKNKE